MIDSEFNTKVKLLCEEIGVTAPSLPDNPQVLLRKILVAFPKLKNDIGILSSDIIHVDIIRFKCKDFNLYTTRSKKEYSKLDILLKKQGRNIEKKEAVFFEDFYRIVTAMVKTSTLNEYEVGDLDKSKPTSSSTVEKPRKKIGTNSSVIKGVAGSLASAMQPVIGHPDMEKGIMSNVNSEFSDLDKVINTGTFRSAVGDNKIFNKIKKAYTDMSKTKRF